MASMQDPKEPCFCSPCDVLRETAYTPRQGNTYTCLKLQDLERMDGYWYHCPHQSMQILSLQMPLACSTPRTASAPINAEGALALLFQLLQQLRRQQQVHTARLQRSSPTRHCAPSGAAVSWHKKLTLWLSACGMIRHSEVPNQQQETDRRCFHERSAAMDSS